VQSVPGMRHDGNWSSKGKVNISETAPSGGEKELVGEPAPL